MEVGFVEFQLALVKNSYIYKQYKKIDLGRVVTCNSKYRLDEEKAQNLRTRFPEFVVFLNPLALEMSNVSVLIPRVFSFF